MQGGGPGGGKGRTRPPLQPPHLFHSVANRPRGRRGDHELARNYQVVPGKPCVSPATQNSRVRGKRWGERLEQSLSWGRQERGSPDRTANSEIRAMPLDVAEPGGRLFVTVPWGERIGLYGTALLESNRIHVETIL